MKTKLLTLLLLASALMTIAQPPAKIWYDETNLRTSAIRNFAQAKYLDCIMNCQRMVALGNGDGLVTGLMAMAYDSLTNQEAADKSRAEANLYKVDSNIIRRLTAANLSP